MIRARAGPGHPPYGGLVNSDATLKVTPLTTETWPAFDALVQRHNGTRQLYERLGFTYVRPKGLKNCVTSLELPPKP